MFAEMTKDYDATTIYVRLLLGKPDFPKVKVPITWRCPGGPPKEWGEITDRMEALDAMDDFEQFEYFVVRDGQIQAFDLRGNRQMKLITVATHSLRHW